MPADEFDTIARLLRPLTRGAPEALGLLDDSAVLAGRPGVDLILTKDAVVQGVHFLADDPLDLVARKLLRVNLSDLAAKGAEPFGYLLAVAWPEGADREAFARGLGEDGEAFGLSLLGGDTVSTPGPLTASVTMLGRVPAGAMVKRSGARPGDLLVVTGTIGDGKLGLAAARGEIDAPELVERYRLPQPRLGLREALRAHAHAAADVSDGLLADAANIAVASGCAVRIDLEKTPLSPAAARWLEGQGDGLLSLATGGDDYEIVCAVPPGSLEAFTAEAGMAVTVVGVFEAGEGAAISLNGKALQVPRLGYRHG
jgi:thiamine-monophosphate kinase